MSIALISLLVFTVLLLAIYFLSKTGFEKKEGKMFLYELKELPSESSPIIVSQIKDGEILKTLCYLASSPAVPEDMVVEVDVRDALSAKLNPVTRFTAQSTI